MGQTGTSLSSISSAFSVSQMQSYHHTLPSSASAAAQKKKGIKSSLGRFFSKKEKVLLLFKILCWTHFHLFFTTYLELNSKEKVKKE